MRCCTRSPAPIRSRLPRPRRAYLSLRGTAVCQRCGDNAPTSLNHSHTTSPLDLHPHCPTPTTSSTHQSAATKPILQARNLVRHVLQTLPRVDPQLLSFHISSPTPVPTLSFNADIWIFAAADSRLRVAGIYTLPGENVTGGLLLPNRVPLHAAASLAHSSGLSSGAVAVLRASNPPHPKRLFAGQGIAICNVQAYLPRLVGLLSGFPAHTVNPAVPALLRRLGTFWPGDRYMQHLSLPASPGRALLRLSSAHRESRCSPFPPFCTAWALASGRATSKLICPAWPGSSLALQRARRESRRSRRSPPSCAAWFLAGVSDCYLQSPSAMSWLLCAGFPAHATNPPHPP
ncbi:hypothetical protein B0H13DRAFT_2311775 [Mycena leptocephala]|nr:hypothetical protein B0H13DRAFT_2311775 [Mycena leptocephala]